MLLDKLHAVASYSGLVGGSVGGVYGPLAMLEYNQVGGGLLNIAEAATMLPLVCMSGGLIGAVVGASAGATFPVTVPVLAYHAVRVNYLEKKKPAPAVVAQK